MKLSCGYLIKKRENGIYYIGFTTDGKFHWKTTKCNRKPDALAFIRNFTLDTTEPECTERLITLNQLKDELSTAKTVRYNTLRCYTNAVKSFIAVCGNRDISKYSASDLERFKQHEMSRTVSDVTINISIRSLVSVFSFAVKRQYLKENPFSFSQTIKIPEKPPVFITQQEFVLILDKIEIDTYREFFIVSANSGMRLSELTNLKWATISLDKKQIAITNTDEFTTKSAKYRIVPMNETVWDILKRRFADRVSDYVFCKPNGIKYNNSYISHKFKGYVRDAKLSDKYHFHSLRHSFASWLALKEVPIFSIQQLLGHSSVNTTLKYAHLSASQLHGAVNKI